VSIWLPWWRAMCLLRPAFSRMSTFLWFTVVVAGLSIRDDLHGVSSIVRALKLKPTGHCWIFFTAQESTSTNSSSCGR
jgi:hypothetical protein